MSSRSHADQFELVELIYRNLQRLTSYAPFLPRSLDTCIRVAATITSRPSFSRFRFLLVSLTLFQWSYTSETIPVPCLPCVPRLSLCRNRNITECNFTTEGRYCSVLLGVCPICIAFTSHRLTLHLSLTVLFTIAKHVYLALENGLPIVLMDVFERNFLHST